jgi:hypothetical protein
VPHLREVLLESHFQADLHKLVQGAQAGMLTTRASDGQLHARAMTPAGREFECHTFENCPVTTVIQHIQTPKLTLSSSRTTPRPNSRRFRMTIMPTSASLTHPLQIGRVILGLPE